VATDIIAVVRDQAADNAEKELRESVVRLATSDYDTCRDGVTRTKAGELARDTDLYHVLAVVCPLLGIADVELQRPEPQPRAPRRAGGDA